MANQTAVDLELTFENFVENYDSFLTISKEAKTSYPDPKDMQRAGDTFYKRQNFHTDVVTGLDVSAATKTDIVDRFVPTVFNQPDNVLFDVDAKEMRDPTYREEMGKAAGQRLAAEIDKKLYDKVANEAGIIVTTANKLSHTDGSLAEALMISRGAAGLGVQRKLFMSPFDYRDVSDEMANKAYMNDVAKDAYENSKVPNVANFRSFRTDNLTNVLGIGTVTGTTINGAQSFTPSAMTGDLPTDNRQMTLTIQGANIANTKNGDAFTIVGVNAVHMIDKSDTGQLMTFRIISGGGTVTPIVSPAIIATGPYQNVSGVAANSSALVFVNTTTAPANPFWADGAVCLDYGKLAFPSGEGTQVKTATTEQGVPLSMSFWFNQAKGKTEIRFTTLYATTVIDRERTGLILAGQV